MQKSVLVDSCVFIDLLRRGLDPAAQLVPRAGNRDLVTCGMVRVEVVRGLKTPRLRRRVEDLLDVMLNVPTNDQLWIETAELAWRLDRSGVALPATDLLIAASAIRMGACVLSYNKHFREVPDLEVLTALEQM